MKSDLESDKCVVGKQPDFVDKFNTKNQWSQIDFLMMCGHLER